MNPTVSVVIPTYNHARFICEAIDSVLGQTLPPHQVVIVDDGSTDGTSEVLKRYGNKICVVRQQNSGVAAARNKGADIATGDLLAFLDADDVWLPRKLELQTARFVEEPQLGLVHCGVQDINEEGFPLREHLDGLEGSVGADLLQFRRPVILGGGSGIVVPRIVFESAGGFDTRLSTSADWDLYYRISSRYKVGFVREVLLRYRLHGSNMHGNVRAMEHDMLLGYEKAFGDAAVGPQANRRRCYGNLHAVLAGSYFSAGQYGGFVRHAMKSVLLTPGSLMRFMSFPIRRWRGQPTDCSSKAVSLETSR